LATDVGSFELVGLWGRDVDDRDMFRDVGLVLAVVGGGGGAGPFLRLRGDILSLIVECVDGDLWFTFDSISALVVII
jgi:hypothetical protein